jgi:hypothetical protein
MHLRQQNVDKAESELRQAVALDEVRCDLPRSRKPLFTRNDLTQAEAALKMSSVLWHSARKLSYARFKLKTGAPDGRKDAEGIAKAPDYIPPCFLPKLGGSSPLRRLNRLLEEFLRGTLKLSGPHSPRVIS